LVVGFLVLGRFELGVERSLTRFLHRRSRRGVGQLDKRNCPLHSFAAKKASSPRNLLL
jgi:hypothetical protein